MPEAPTATPAAAPAAPPATPAPAATPPAVPGPAAPRPGPSIAPSPAKQRSLDALRKLARPAEDASKPRTPAPAAEPAKPAAPATPVDVQTSKGKEGTPTPPAGEKPAGEPAAVQKQSPWTLVNSLKKERENLRTRLAEFEAKSGDVPTLTKRAETAESQLKEALEELRYQNYAKHPEFKEKYQEPYEKAWQRAVHDVTQLTVADEEGNTRPATADDLFRVVNLPLGDATKLAKELFGDDLGNFVMSHHYTKVRELAEAQQEALEKARKDGDSRQQQAAQAQQAIRQEVGQTFEKLRDEAVGQLDFMKAKEGDEDWNKRLTKATTFVDTTMRSSVFDPKLSPEDRNTLIAQHVAVRNRAIGFSMLKLENTRLRAEVAERDKKLAAYQNAQPGGGEGRPATGEGAPAPGGNTMEALKAKLRAMAKPIM